MCDKSGNYLTVNNEDFLISPVARKRHVTRKNRTASPNFRPSSSMISLDDSVLLATTSNSPTEYLRPSSANSLYNINFAQSSESLGKRHKSIDNLCFGRKKLYRQAHVQEVYRPRCNTDSALNEEKHLRSLTIPILRIPEDDSSQGQQNNEENPSSSSPTDTTPSTPTEHRSIFLYERKHSGSGSGVLGSLLKQTIKVTTASMGFRAASMERLAPATFQPLNEDVKQRFSRSTSSVSTLAQLPSSPMAPLQTHTECQSVQCLNILDKDYKSLSSTNTKTGTTASSSSPPQKVKKTFQHQLSIPESLQTTSIGCATSSENSSSRSFKHSAASLTPLPTLQSSGSSRSISPLRRSASGNSSSTAKHEQSNTAAATAVAAATATTSNGSLSTTTTPPEKEKKRKEISSSRVKKFHRHFSQVSKDEKLINYFSCALVSDILLQGHLYITDQHFAFYSNVFGYVTKVVIPTSSVTKISKEKTAKIIPNAVGVATADERHVFGSFISREAAFRLMCSVCPPLGIPEILPKDPANIEISEECSIEDDSSCSISGNESPAQITELLSSKINGNLLHNDTSQTLLRRSVGSSNLSLAEKANDKIRHSDVPTSANTATNAASLRSSAPPTATINAHYANGSGGVKLMGLKSVLQPATHEIEGKLTLIAGCASTTTSASSTPTPSSSSAPTTVMTLPMSKANHALNILRNVSKNLMSHIKFPTEIHVVYLGVVLTLLLALFSIFLLYRILDIEAKANGYRSPVEFDWRSGNDDEIFREALRFQKQLQLKSTEEAQSILKTNLEQIAKVRRSLETLSMLIHDRSSSFISTNTDDSD